MLRRLCDHESDVSLSVKHRLNLTYSLLSFYDYNSQCYTSIYTCLNRQTKTISKNGSDLGIFSELLQIRQDGDFMQLTNGPTINQGFTQQIPIDDTTTLLTRLVIV